MAKLGRHVRGWARMAELGARSWEADYDGENFCSASVVTQKSLMAEPLFLSFLFIHFIICYSFIHFVN